MLLRMLSYLVEVNITWQLSFLLCFPDTDKEKCRITSLTCLRVISPAHGNTGRP